ncbi:hypothetical protein HU755_11915 [Pseudomonas sp. SWRI111]|uniref:hypothetical protein n=1 Tax=Pseudomonas sp. SWRI111 TaxID=2745507 RepID=UPI0016448E61|nr:hypothetical protein [Pseudomonas sp. SWRI111]MBC3207496.1 hypothetical protein [Pseudomonas sp. SWRI111]
MGDDTKGRRADRLFKWLGYDSQIAGRSVFAGLLDEEPLFAELSFLFQAVVGHRPLAIAVQWIAK